LVDPATDTTIESLKGTAPNKKTLYDIWNILYCGINVSADIITADIESITGASPNNKTLYDVWNTLNTQLDITLSALRDALLSCTVTYPGGIDDVYNKLNAQLDITISALRDAILDGTVTYPYGVNDVYTKLNTQLDITLSAHRDGLKGTGARDFTTLETDVEGVKSDLDSATGIYSAQVTVGTTAVQLATNQAVHAGCEVVVKADDDNTGYVYIGPSGVTTSTGFRLNPGQSISYRVDNVNRLYAIASAASQKVHVTCEV